MHQSEVAVYSRLTEIQGTMIPRLIASVELDIAPEGLDIPDQHQYHFQVKRILLEYIQGFTLSDLIDIKPEDTWLATLPSIVPHETLQDIVDQGVRICEHLGRLQCLEHRRPPS